MKHYTFVCLELMSSKINSKESPSVIKVANSVAEKLATIRQKALIPTVFRKGISQKMKHYRD